LIFNFQSEPRTYFRNPECKIPKAFSSSLTNTNNCAGKSVARLRRGSAGLGVIEAYRNDRIKPLGWLLGAP
jgi:hypothetical protein